MDNIILIGMAGAGKSTIGVLLAKALGYAFIDTDLCIQAQESALLHEIIERNGMDYMLDAEARAVESLDVSRSVIATGGSVIYRNTGMSHLKKLGEVVYLDVSYEEIERRLGDITSRGIVMGNHETLRELYDERRDLYDHYADHNILCDDKGIEQLVGELTARYRGETC